MRVRRVLSACGVVAGILVAAPLPARAATADGSIITNLVSIAWTTVWGVTATGAQFTQTSATAYATVISTAFGVTQDWWNVTAGAKANPVPGDVIQFTVTITNSGATPLTTIHVTDTLAAGLTYQAGSLNVEPAAGWTTNAAGAILRADQSGSTIAPGGTALIVFSATVDPVCTTVTIGNTAYFDGAGSLLGASPVFVVAGPVTDLSVTHQVTDGGSVGSVVTYQITVANTGETTVTDLTVTDTVAALVTGAAAGTPAGWAAPVVTSVASGTRFVWTGTGLTLWPGTSTTFTIAGAYGLVCVPTQLSNTVVVTGGNSCARAAPHSAVAAGSVIAPYVTAVALRQDVVQAPVNSADPVKYRLVVSNTGTATITSLTVADTVAPQVVGVTTEQTAPFGAPGVTQGPSGTIYVWSASAAALLVPGATFTFTITGAAGSVCVQTAVSNTGYVAGVGTCAGASALSAPAAGFVITAPTMDFTVTSQLTGGGTVGAAMSYGIIVANTGTATITNLTVVDTVPAVIANQAAGTPAGWAAPVVTSVASGTRYVWSGAGLSLSPGATTTFAISGNYGVVCVPTPVSDTPYATGGISCAQVNHLGNAAGMLLPPVTTGLAVSMLQTPASPAIGSLVTYRVVVTNTGTATITNLVVVDSIPGLVMSATASEPSGFPTPTVASGSVFTWGSSAANLGLGQSFTFTVTGTVGAVCANTAASASAFVTGTAVCSTTVLTTNPVGFVVPAPVTGLTIVKTQTPASPGTGSPVTYRIVVANSGDATITSLTVTDTISPVVTAAAGDQPAGFGAASVTNSSSGTLFGWNSAAANLGPGKSFTFTITGVVGPICVQTAVSNTAYATGTSACSATVVSTSPSPGFVLSAPVMDFTVTKQVTGTAAVGLPVTYTITVANTGEVTIQNLTVVDTVSAVVAGPAAGTPPGWAAPVVTSVVSGTRFVWTGAGLVLGPGTSTTFTIAGTYGVVGNPTQVSNTAYATGGISCAQVMHYSNTVGALILPPAALAGSMSVLPNPQSVGHIFLLTLTVTDTGAAGANGVSPAAPLVTGSGAAVLVSGPIPSPPVALAGGGAVTFTWTYTATVAGNLLFTVTVTGTDAVSAGALSIVRSAAMVVQSAASLAGTLACSPNPAAAGATVQAVLTVTNSGAAAVQGATPAIQVNAGSGLLTLLSGPSPAGPLTIPGGAAQSFTWTYSMTGAGVVSLTATVAGLDVNAGTPVVVAGSSVVTVAVPASLVSVMAVSPSPGYVGYWLTVDLTVTNTGGASAGGITPSLTVATGASLVAAVNGPVPAGPVTLPGGSSVTFRWTYSVSGAGAVSFSASATGTDGTFFTAAISGAAGGVTLQTAGTLAAGLAVTPPVASLWQQLVTVELTVTNTGGATVNTVAPALQVNRGAGVLTLLSGPVPAGPVSIASGLSQTFVWTYTASGAGWLSFTGTGTGVDTAGGGTVGAAASASATMQTGANLVCALAATVPSPLGARQPITLVLTVTNTGDAAAIGALPSADVGPAPETAGEKVGGPVPAGPVAIPGHGTVAFTWIVQAIQAPPTLTFTVTVEAQDANSGAPLAAARTTAALVVSADGRLVASAETSPVEVREGETAEIRLTVENTGISDVLNVQPSLTLADPRLAKVVSGPVPTGGLTLTATGSVVFVWRVTAQREGHLVYTAAVTGVDSNSGAPLSAGVDAVETFVEIRPARFFKVKKGSALVAPNVLDLSDPSSNLHFVFKGKAGGHVALTIYDEAHRYVGAEDVVLDWSGMGEISTRNGRLGILQLGQGVHWAVAKGGGVDDILPFVVVVKRKLQ
ncbi:MAG: hypothetical protein AAB152_18670 [Candidatus Coatesbacteria bacterium]